MSESNKTPYEQNLASVLSMMEERKNEKHWKLYIQESSKNQLSDEFKQQNDVATAS